MLEKYKAQETLARVKQNFELHELSEISSKLQMAALEGKTKVTFSVTTAISQEFLIELSNGGIDSNYRPDKNSITFYMRTTIVDGDF